MSKYSTQAIMEQEKRLMKVLGFPEFDDRLPMWDSTMSEFDLENLNWSKTRVLVHNRETQEWDLLMLDQLFILDPNSTDEVIVDLGGRSKRGRGILNTINQWAQKGNPWKDFTTEKLRSAIAKAQSR